MGQTCQPFKFSNLNILAKKIFMYKTGNWVEYLRIETFCSKKQKQTVLCRKVGNQFGYQFALRIFSISWDYEIQFKTHNKTLRLGRSGVAFIYF